MQAFFSVSEKEGVGTFAKSLHDRGCNILASGGTALSIEKEGVPVTNVASLLQSSLRKLMQRWQDQQGFEIAGEALEALLRMVGEPLLNHRVVTLSREVFAGILARYIDEDRREIELLGVPYIDLVCVDLYHLEEYLEKYRRGEIDAVAVIEKIDIGGPSLLRAAAKAGRIVISEPAQRDQVLSWIDDGQPNEKCFRMQLASKAELVAGHHAQQAHLFWELESMYAKCY